MKKTDIDKLFAVETVEKNGVVAPHSITLNPKGEKIVKVPTSSPEGVAAFKSAVTAWVDLARYGRYPGAIQGLHPSVDLNEVAFMASNIAVISPTAINEWGLPVPTEEQAPLGFAAVDLYMGRYVIRPFSTEKNEYGESEMTRRSRKHGFVDGYLLGYGFSLRVPVFLRGWLETVLTNAYITDDTKAEEARSQALSRWFNNEKVLKPAWQKATEDAKDSEVPVPDQGKIMFRVVKSGERVDMDNLPAGKYMVFNHLDRAQYAKTWDPNSKASRLFWASLPKTYAIQPA